MPHKHNARSSPPHFEDIVHGAETGRNTKPGRGDSLPLWIAATALECWQITGPGGQSRYAEAAIRRRHRRGLDFLFWNGTSRHRGLRAA